MLIVEKRKCKDAPVVRLSFFLRGTRRLFCGAAQLAATVLRQKNACAKRKCERGFTEKSFLSFGSCEQPEKLFVRVYCFIVFKKRGVWPAIVKTVHQL